jgi:hypothetical protein
VMVAERLQARWAKAHKPLPDDLDQVIVIAAAKVGWDYLFQPGDDRHRHATDSGGNCRNPACTFQQRPGPQQRNGAVLDGSQLD